MCKVGVVLPCYNGARWIAGAINSVLDQTHGDFELIIVDDGSTDNSKEIIYSYLHDDRVRYIYQKNKGFSSAINRGIKVCECDLIGFIGQDDLWMPNKLEFLIGYLNKYKHLEIIHSNYCNIDSEGNFKSLRTLKIPNFSSRKKLIKHLFLHNFIGFETVLVKKGCFKKTGLFDEKMVGFSDYDMWLKLVGDYDIGYIDLVLVKKRDHKGQLSKVRRSAMIKDEFLIVQKAIKRYPFLKSIAGKKLSYIYYRWGMFFLTRGNTKEAKKKFFRAIRCLPWHLKSVVAFFIPDLYLVFWERYLGLRHSFIGNKDRF